MRIIYHISLSCKTLKNKYDFRPLKKNRPLSQFALKANKTPQCAHMHPNKILKTNVAVYGYGTEIRS